ncbi:MAG TPA: two-component regulator propeller domain-containing protein, partial [Puia sp.]|nr:two-component regulator propeller domain-containing protein [Puia sp.]
MRYPPTISAALLRNCTCVLRIMAIFTLLACLLPTKAQAQYDLYRFSRLDINQGLSHNEINCFVKDEKGFLWIGTMAGLNRYDGYKLKIFRHDLRDTSSLSDDYIEKIFEGPFHKLWAFTRNGINIYDPLTEKFERNAQPFLSSIHIPHGELVGFITDIKKDSLGNYWFVSDTTGIYKFNPSTNSTTRFYHREGDRSSLYSNNITSITQNKAGDWWIVYKDGIMEKMNGATERITLQVHALKDISSEASLNYRVYADRQDGLWLYGVASSQGVFYYDELTGAVRHFDKGQGRYDLNNNLVDGIIQDEKGLIWIATDHGGVNLLDKKDFSIQKIMNRADDDKSISQNSINAIYADKEGIIWIGTFKKGVCYHHADLMKFPLYRHQLPDAKNPNYDDVNRFVEDPKGNLWIGSNGGGLLYFNRQTGHCTQYLHDPSNPNSLSNDVIVSLCLDHEQKLWIGTYFGGLDCYDGKTFRHFRHNDSDTGSIADDRIWDILEDSRQQLWVGTFSQGLDRLDKKNNTFIHYKPFAPHSVKSGYITGLIEDRKGNIWISTAYGVDVLDKATGDFRHYGHDSNHPTTSLSIDNTFGIMEDSRGLIWVATREGLDLFDPVGGLFRTFRKENGLPDNTILDILEDNNHSLWLSTHDGLSNVSVLLDTVSRRVNCQFRNYDESDGLQGREFNENAACRTRKGEMIFGGAYGFNIFDPQRIRRDPKNQVITLTDLQVFNKSVNIGEKLNGHVILPQSISSLSTITLRYNENVFSIEFAALDFSSPEKVKYAYMLESFNKQWLLSDDKTRKAVFTNLDPGDYIFKVKTADDKGGWNPRELSLNIKILPPFWKTPLAYILYGILLAATLFIARRMTLQRARARFAIEQERKEAQRLHELDMMKIRFFTNVSHEFRTPLSLILTPMDKIIRDTDNPARKGQFQLIHRNARRLLNMVNQLLDFRKLEEQELKLSLSKGDIIKFIKELSFSFADMAEKKHIDLSFHTSEKSLYTLFDQDKLERIVFNLLSNAFKFTPEKGLIVVELDWLPGQDIEEQGLLQLVIRDTGIGMEKEQQEKIFDRFYQNEIPGSMINQGSGIGLAITREFVRLHKGTIHVDSAPGKGSSFTVVLPIEKADALAIDLPAAENYLSPDPDDYLSALSDPIAANPASRLPPVAYDSLSIPHEPGPATHLSSAP